MTDFFARQFPSRNKVGRAAWRETQKRIHACGPEHRPLARLDVHVPQQVEHLAVRVGGLAREARHAGRGHGLHRLADLGHLGQGLLILGPGLVDLAGLADKGLQVPVDGLDLVELVLGVLQVALGLDQLPAADDQGLLEVHLFLVFGAVIVPLGPVEPGHELGDHVLVEEGPVVAVVLDLHLVERRVANGPAWRRSTRRPWKTGVAGATFGLRAMTPKIVATR